MENIDTTTTETTTKNMYNNGKIYKIVCNVTGKCYIGSTVVPTLAQRMWNHRSTYKKWKNDGDNHNLKPCKSVEVLDGGDYNIILVENYPCNSKDELLMRERFHIENTNCVNSCCPIRTEDERIEQKKQYTELYKPYKVLYDKAYNLEHKEKKNQQSKEYYENNKEKVKQYSRDWYSENKDRLKDIKKDYYEKKKEANKERLYKKTVCECGVEYTFCNRARHFKSKLHTTNLELKQLKA